ncbi:hypothetical protein CHT99_06750 [Sphingobacterium cellulitidis]|nr:hypothetical protein CHT99_06750 [Sphingobacterium cellulitidis]
MAQGWIAGIVGLSQSLRFPSKTTKHSEHSERALICMKPPPTRDGSGIERGNCGAEPIPPSSFKNNKT